MTKAESHNNNPSKMDIVKKICEKCEQHYSQKTGTGTNSCKAIVIIEHVDTLNQPFPAGIIVTVYDKYSNKIKGITNQEGISKHNEVHCGEIFWQLEKSVRGSKGLGLSDGRLLIKAKNRITGEKKENNNPKKQLAKPLKLEVAVNQANITATYLPPPIICNLRAELEDNDLLTHAEITQLKAAGDNVTFFIHGYNVSMGELGILGDCEDWGKTTPCSKLINKKQLQSPFLYHSQKEIEQMSALIMASDEKNRKSPGRLNSISIPRLDQHKNQLNNNHNGEGSYQTMIAIEYYLNLAAANKLKANESIDDWENYTRIVGVAWKGDESAREFNKSILNANLAARRLAKVLRDLISKGIKINIITHSLGARVALGALNILGDFDVTYDDKIDNVFLWQPAVADNALSNNLANDRGPLKETVFPFAHKTANYISVLYSNNDGILGGDDTKDTDLVEVTLSAIGGAYSKRYWWIASGTEAMGKYYKELIWDDLLVVTARQASMMRNYGSGMYDPELINQGKLANEKMDAKLAKAIRTEAEQINADADIAAVKYLSPWAHHRRFTEKQIEFIIKILQSRKLADFDVQEQNLRPALGHIGDSLTSNAEKKAYFDAFITDKFRTNAFNYLDQTEYYMSHSALTIDSDIIHFSQIYEEGYEREIMLNIKKRTNFGNY